MKILLTGGTGFLGSRLFSYLSNKGLNVVIASRNPGINQVKITPGELLPIKLHEFDIIINAAGKYVRNCRKEDIHSISEANIGVCESISRSIDLVSKGVINLSSYFEIVSSESPISKIFYTKSKVSGNNILQNACKAKGKLYSRIILFDNYDRDLSRGKILDQLLQSALTGKSICINNVESVLNLLSTEQVSYGIMQVIESYNTSKPFIGRIDIKNQINYKILNLIDIIESTSKRKILVTNLNQSLDIAHQKVVLEKLDNIINFSLSDELPRYIKKMLEMSV